ncbi:uncharacterized protein LOC142817801 [Rhipicephalus microplus]|uniref:uncharacterized protein LOC142817801 n=1 Tax=Rhipicephalus microplus TaxID=6941 RepID=UPI003F6A6D4F
MMPDLRVFPMQAALALLVVWLPAVSSDSACSHLLWQVHSSGVKTTSSGIFFNATSSAKLDHHLPTASTMTSLPGNHKSSLRTNLFLSGHGSSASSMMPDLRVFPMQIHKNTEVRGESKLGTATWRGTTPARELNFHARLFSHNRKQRLLQLTLDK